MENESSKYDGYYCKQMDYRELLKKYFKYIIEVEGVDYITLCESLMLERLMTEEEISELNKIAEEVE